MNIIDCYNKSPYLSIKHTTYFHAYQKLFSPYIGKRITFVEIGVLNGGSLFMWREFFGPEARIIGIDLNPGAKKWEAEGFEIFIGSQTDTNFWNDFYKQVGPIDILLDDGGHTFEQQIITFACSLPFINDDGLLVVEDTHTSYMKDFGGPSPLSFVSFAKNIVDGINYRFAVFDEAHESEKIVYSVTFYESIISFDINRFLAGIKSQTTSNWGQTSNAHDFRYDDGVSISASALLRHFKY